MTRLRSCFSYFLLINLCLFVSMGCPGPADQDERPTRQTTVTGTSPLHRNGGVRALDVNGTVIGSSSTDADGNFTLELKQESGNFLLEAFGGSYRELSSKSEVSDGDPLRAMVVGLESMGTTKVLITPWSEIAVSASSGRDADTYTRLMAVLSSAMTCNRSEHREVTQTAPVIPQADATVEGLDTATLSYLYLGAWSQLASNLSTAAGTSPGTRVSSLRLASALSKDAADGRIDGYNNGEPITLVENLFLSDDLLRQPLAQAARRFIDSKSNMTQVKFGDVKDLLGCISTNAHPLLGAPGQSLDTDGPLLELAAPSDGVFLVDEHDFQCGATDASKIVDFSASLLTPGGENLQRGPKQDTVRRGATAGKLELFGVLEIAPHQSGPVTFVCSATDEWGNTNEARRSYVINRGGIKPKILGLETSSEEKLTGVNVITCDCSEDPYNDRCELTAPANATLRERKAHSATYTWATTGGLDGIYTVECSNFSRGYDEAFSATKSFTVNNNPPGFAQGTVFLDTPVTNVTVTAYAYADGEPGAVLGSGEARDGHFHFPLKTTYRGPLLFKAVRTTETSERALFHNLAIDDDMTLNNGYLTALLEKYEPSEKITDLSINVASSLAEALATARWKLAHDVGDFATEVLRDQHLVAQHVHSARDFDVRRTPVQNLSERVRAGALEQEKAMGLFHVGLSRLAAQFSAQRCPGSLTCITVTDLLNALREDLQDGILDGYNGELAVTLDKAESIGPELLRIDLSRAIKNWLDAVPFINNTETVPKNASGLTSNVYGAKGQLLRNLAGDSSPLFGGRAGRRYDQDGPIVHIKATNRTKAELTRPTDLGQLHIVLTRPVNADFELQVDATDESQVVGLHAFVNGIELRNVEGGNPAHGQYVVSLKALELGEGPSTVVVTALDGENNTTTVRVTFTVDREPPTVRLDQPEVWIRDGDMHRVTGTVAKAGTRGALHVSGVKLTDFEPSSTLRFETAAPVACNATHTLRLEFEDQAGNVMPVEQTVHCDDTPPVVTPIAALHKQARTGQQTPLTVRVHDAASSPSFAPLTNTSEATLVERFFYQLDGDSADLPVARFTVTDKAKGVVGAEPDDVKVSYTYKLNGSTQRDWTPVTCSVEQEALLCVLPFSYHSMLPDEVLSQPLSMKRARNFIARSTPNDLHSVIFKIEDSVGNVTVAEWSLRLDLVGPAFRVSCDAVPGPTTVMDPTNAAFNTLLHHGAALYTARVEAQATGSFENSLAPDDARYVFSIPDASFTWRIDNVSVQWAKLGRSNHNPKWPETFGNFVQFDGENVQPAGRQFLKSVSWDEVPNLSVEQLAVGRHRALSLSFHGSQETALAAAQDAPLPLSWQQTYNGKARLQYSYKHGWYATCSHKAGTSRDRCRFHQGATELDERRFTESLKIIRRPYFPRLSDHSGLPAPLHVDYDDNCKVDTYLIWHEGEGADSITDMSSLADQ